MAASLEYRPDIDGLRAVAVSAVVLFHAGATSFAGGYVGVDIFFVISGFLITSILRGHLAEGQFSLWTFYAARARRIMPALITMLSAVSVLSFWVLLPDELTAFGQNLVQSLLFTVNIFLWRDTGYFSLDANLRPLLHMWSLAVEEQFYLLWPPLLWLLDRLRRPKLAIITCVAILAASLVISQWGAIHQPSGAFYLAPSRAWELMLGALIAMTRYRIRNPIFQEVGAAAGLGLIAYAIFTFQRQTPFPGFYAMIPCLGAALLICAGPGPRISRILSTAPFTATGRISYSLYLWHWPLLVLGALALNRPLHATETLLVVTVSIALAALSWFLIEQPVRTRFDAARKPVPILAWTGVAISPLLIAGIFLAATKGFPGRYPQAAMERFNQSQDHTTLWQRCHTPEGPSIPPRTGCIFGAKGASSGYEAILWGDSHADALQPALDEIARKNGFRVRQMTKSSCPVVMSISTGAEKTPEAARGCRDFNRAVMHTITHDPGIKAVIISSSWHSYSYSNSAPPDATNGKILADDMISLLRWLAKNRVKVVVVGEVPEAPIDLSRCYLRSTLLGFDRPWCMRFLPESQERLDAVDAIIEKAVATQSEAAAIFPKARLCDQKTCNAMEGGALLYRDRDHLSIAGANYIAPLFKELRP